MKSTWIKCAALTVLAGAAAWSAVSALSGISALASRPEEKRAPFHYEPSCAIEEAEFVLRSTTAASECSARSRTPAHHRHGHRDALLREADREIVKNGIAVADREELLTLLEDLAREKGGGALRKNTIDFCSE